MSSNIQIQRICQFCNKEFTARTTVTKYCSQKCASKAYKARTRKKKIEKSNTDTVQIKNRPIEDIKVKEFLSVREVSILLGCSLRTVYRLIDNGTIKAVNLAERMTRVKKSELHKILEQPRPKTPEQTKSIEYEISDCYTINEILEKYGISPAGFYNLAKKHEVPKIKKGKFVYVPRPIIDDLLS